MFGSVTTTFSPWQMKARVLPSSMPENMVGMRLPGVSGSAATPQPRANFSRAFASETGW